MASKIQVKLKETQCFQCKKGFKNGVDTPFTRIIPEDEGGLMKDTAAGDKRKEEYANLKDDDLVYLGHRKPMKLLPNGTKINDVNECAMVYHLKCI
jgi:hypothetical protein